MSVFGASKRWGRLFGLAAIPGLMLSLATTACEDDAGSSKPKDDSKKDAGAAPPGMDPKLAAAVKSNAIVYARDGATITADQVVIRRNPNASVGGNQPDGPMGSVDVDGTLDVNTLDLQLTAVDPILDPVRGGVEGPVTIDNPNNRIGTLPNRLAKGTEAFGDFFKRILCIAGVI